MIQIDFILSPFIIGANAILEDLSLRIKQLEFSEEDESVIFYIHDYVDNSEIPMTVPFYLITNWINAKTDKGRNYLMQCIIKDILFDYEDVTYELHFDETDKIYFNYK